MAAPFLISLGYLNLQTIIADPKIEKNISKMRPNYTTKSRDAEQISDTLYY